MKRFQIQDILTQDLSGITFLAIDSETSANVAVLRFFPYEVDGRGMHQEEQVAYKTDVDRLMRVSHPALRTVVCGGCDPVDGIPFIAMEWHEGDPLHDTLENGPLTAEAAIHMLMELLEICEQLSNVLDEEAIWVETGLHTIVDGDDDSRSRFTFGISLSKWLDGDGVAGGFATIITLAEKIMGWKDRAMQDSTEQDLAERDLAAWLKWLGSAKESTTISEAREMLAMLASYTPLPPPTWVARTAPAKPPAPATQAAPVPSPVSAVRANPTKHLVASAINRPLQPSSANNSRKTASSIKPRLILIGLTLLLAGLGGGWWFSSVNPGLLNLSFAFGKPAVTSPENSPGGDGPADETLATAVIQCSNRDTLIQHAKQQITLEGIARGVGTSASGKTVYLFFAPVDEKEAVRVGMEIKDVYPETIRENLKYFVDKKVRVKGTVTVRKLSGEDRPEVLINNLSAIRIAN